MPGRLTFVGTPPAPARRPRSLLQQAACGRHHEARGVHAERAVQPAAAPVQGQELARRRRRRRPDRRRPSSAGRPRNWMRCSNWSLQKNGIGAYGRRLAAGAAASRLRAACAPCSAAFVQCSTRISWPSSSLGQRATSPAANTPGRRRWRSVRRRTRSRRAAPARCPPASPSPGDADADDDDVGRHRRPVAQRDPVVGESPRPPRRSADRCRGRCGRAVAGRPSRRRDRGSAAPAHPRARSPRSPWPAPSRRPRGR